MAHDIRTITVRLDRDTRLGRIEHYRSNPLRLSLALPDQPWDGCTEVRAEIHPQRTQSGQTPLAAASVGLPTGYETAVEFSTAQMTLPMAGDTVRPLWLLVRAIWPESVAGHGPNEDVYYLGKFELMAHPSSDIEPEDPPPALVFASVEAVQALADEIATKAAQADMLAGLATKAAQADMLAAQDKIAKLEIGHAWTFAEFKALNSDPDYSIIVLRDDIVIDENITIPAGKQIFFNGHKFVKSGSPIVVFLGNIVDGRVQVFAQTITPHPTDPLNEWPTITGWDYGDIIGNFGGQPLFPEWWNKYLAVNYEDGVENGYDDVPINCAIQACNQRQGGSEIFFNTISLASAGQYSTHTYSRQYWISRTIHLSGTICFAKGNSMGGVYFTTTRKWNWQNYFRSYYHPARVNTGSGWGHPDGPNTMVPNTLSAVVCVGAANLGSDDLGDFWGQQTDRRAMNTGIENVIIQCYEAARLGLIYEQAHPGDPTAVRRVAGVVCKGWAEENCMVRRCTINNYSGFGAGCPGISHTEASTNGFQVIDCWINHGMCRSSVGVYNPSNSGQMTMARLTVASPNSGAKMYTPYWNMACPGVNFLYLRGLPTLADSVTIGGVVYTFVAAASIAGEVTRGANTQASIDNLEAAINGTDGVNSAHPTVRANQHTVKYGNWLRILSRTAGTAGNGIACSSSNTANAKFEMTSTNYGSNAGTVDPLTTRGFYEEPPVYGIRAGGRSQTVDNVHFEGFIVALSFHGNQTTAYSAMNGRSIDHFYAYNYNERFSRYDGIDTENLLPPVIPTKAQMVSMAAADFPHFINPSEANNNNNGANLAMFSATVGLGNTYEGTASYGNWSNGIANTAAVTLIGISCNAYSWPLSPLMVVRDDVNDFLLADKRGPDSHYNGTCQFFSRGRSYAVADAAYPWGVGVAGSTDPTMQVRFIATI